MLARVLGVSVVGGCLGLFGCSSDGAPGAGSSGAPGGGGASGAQAGASGAAQGGSPAGSSGASAGGAAGSAQAGGGSAGTPGSTAGAGGQAGGGAGASGAGGSSGGAGAAGTAGAGTGGAGGAGDQPGCLPDVSGSITMTFSGAMSFNETRGNDYTCLANFSNASTSATLVLRVDDPQPQPYGVVLASMPKFEAGQMGSIPFDMLTFAVTPGGLWNDPNGDTPTMKRCTLNVSANQALAMPANDYRVSGTITCSSALPGFPDTMTVQKLQFVTLFTPAP